MAKRFFYVSFGILCLVAAYQLGAEQARADWNQQAGGTIVGLIPGHVWTASGECWTFGSSGWGARLPGSDLPIPADEVSLLAGDVLISTSDELWHLSGGAWVSLGPLPASPVFLDGASWGKIKSLYR